MIQRHILEPIQQSQITLSDEYIRKLKLYKDYLVIQKNHNGTIKSLLQM